MNNVLDNEVALTVLHKYDTHCAQIIDCCNKVKVYNFDKQQNAWVVQDQSEGVFYLIKRVLFPLYKFVILSKCNRPGSVPSTIDIAISQHYVSERRQNFFMFKNELGVIKAIMFTNKTDCDRIFLKVEKILNELREPSEKVIQQSLASMRPKNLSGISANDRKSESLTDSASNDDKILSLLESARQRYKEGHGDQPSMSTSAPDRRSRQIDINELFMTSNGVSTPAATIHSPAMTDMSCSYPERNISTRTKSLDVRDNGPATLTVTELEKYFVQGASVADKNKPIADDYNDDEDDDDGHLLDPHMLVSGASNSRPVRDSTMAPILSKDQLREALIQVLQTADDDDEAGSRFLTQLHTAYVDLCHKRATARK